MSNKAQEILKILHDIIYDQENVTMGDTYTLAIIDDLIYGLDLNSNDENSVDRFLARYKKMVK